MAQASQKLRREYRGSKFTHRTFDPFTKAVGQFCLAWNDLHEALGDLFVVLMWHDPQRDLAVWGSVFSDRSKRDALEALLQSLACTQSLRWMSAQEDIKWLLHECTKLEDHRNNVLHAPLTRFANPYTLALLNLPPGSVVPYIFGQNKRANRLWSETIGKGRDALSSIRDYRDRASRYAAFARLMTRAIAAAGHQPWPERPPRPPSRGAPSSSARRSGRATPPPRPQSSPGS
jgi:hypothetical protein